MNMSIVIFEARIVKAKSIVSHGLWPRLIGSGQVLNKPESCPGLCKCVLIGIYVLNF